MTHDNRCRIFIACEPADYAKVQAKVKASGLTQQEFFLRAALEQPVVIPKDIYEYERFAIELKKLRRTMQEGDRLIAAEILKLLDTPE